MTAALTALPPAAPRAAAPGARVSQPGDFAQVLERVSAERPDRPAPRDRGTDRTEPVRDRADGPRVAGDSDTSTTDAQATAGTDAADGGAVAPQPPTDAPALVAPLATDVPLDAPDAAVAPAADGPVLTDGTVPADSPVVATDTLTALLAATAAPTATTSAVTTGKVDAPAPLAATTTATTASPSTTPTTAAPTGPAPAAPAAVDATDATAGTATVADEVDSTGRVATTTAELRPVAPSTEPAPAPTTDRASGAATVTAPPVTAAPAPTAPAPAPVVAPALVPVRATPVPLAEQLGARLTALTGPGGLGHGQHVLTVPIDPENLGPVRIVAHIGPESVRVELVGATEAAREALRGSLTELRRDLAASGLTVDVGAHGDRPEGREPDGRGPTTRGDARVPTAEPVVPVPVVPDRPPSGGLDLLA